MKQHCLDNNFILNQLYVAEYDENGSSHSWFIGYSNVDKPDLVVAIIVEGGGTGSEAAVPIAADLFDAYYFD